MAQKASNRDNESLNSDTDIRNSMSYDIDEIEGIEKLRKRMKEAGSDITAWSHILKDYVKFGNNKVHKSVAIFNMNSATDCVNRNTENCQVPDGMCYAYNDENNWPYALAYRRRQEYLWDCLDADTFAKAFLELVSRKRNPVTAIRFNESGDMRHRGDIIKTNRIAEIVTKEDIDVYTYSASSYLNWDHAEHFTVNMSDNRKDQNGDFVTNEYGDRRFMAIPKDETLPDNAVWCPFDYYDGDNLDERPKCGECQLCINQEGPNVAIPIH